VHRHRIAPVVAATIDRMQDEGRASFAAGRITTADAASLSWRPRGSDRIERLAVDRIVNCTGPELDIVRAGEPLFDALIAAGRIRKDVCRIGLDVDPECRTIDANGAPADTLFAIGPVTRGTFWESVAVPDIRVQTHRLAARMRDQA